jgi:poly(3-hydroxybutyrate) depolymerase
MERRQFVTGLSSLIVSAAASAACAGVGAPVPTTRPPRVPGQSTWRESVDGHEREAIALTPPGSGPTPLVIVMHGSKGSPEQMIGDHGWAETLRARGWAGLFPRTGHEGKPVQDGTGDTSFLLQLLDRAPKELEIDRSRVYAVGFSGGARSVYLLAAQHGERLSAIGACSGVVAMKEDPPGLSDPRGRRGKLSVIHIHGGQDTKIPAGGGEIRAGDGSVRHALPVDEGLSRWVEHLDARPDEGQGDRIPPGSGAQIRRWRSASGYGVQRVLVPGLGHTWGPPWVNEMITRFLDAAPPQSL